MDGWQNVSLVSRVLSERFIVRLCTTSYRLLKNFLSNHELLTIIDILNERVKVIIEDRPSQEKFEGAKLGGESILHGVVRRSGMSYLFFLLKLIYVLCSSPIR